MVSDVVGAAMYKYHEDCYADPYKSDIQETADVSILLHPNSDEFSWYGDRPFVDFLSDFFGKTKIQDIKKTIDEEFGDHFSARYVEQPVSHRFGAYSLRPEQQQNDIKRVFSMIFHYHMGLTSLCLNCGRELHLAHEFVSGDWNEFSPSSCPTMQSVDAQFNPKNPSTNFWAICHDCKDRWYVGFCATGERHGNSYAATPHMHNRLIKAHDDEGDELVIHARGSHGDVHCPSCQAVIN